MTLDLAHIEAVFLDECREQLGVLEDSLLSLEQTPDDGDVLGRMFRAAHSIKGGAATFGLATVARLTHGMESLLDAMRAGRIRATAIQVDALLAGADRVRALLAARADGAAEPSIDEALAACERALDPPLVATVPAERRVRIQFAPGPDTLRAGVDPILVLRELASVGRLAGGRVDAGAIPPLDALEPLGCYLRWDLGLDSAAPLSAIRELFDYAEDGSDLTLTEDGGASAVDPPAGPAEGAASTRPAPRAVAADATTATLRVATDKIDRLMNLVGELLINQSMVVQAVRTFRPENLASLQEACIEMERTTREVQERVMAIRMLPVATVFGRLPRLVRDLSARLGKPAAIELHGEDTELDKGVLDGLIDPLTHLVRNALDHGLEPPQARLAAGKPETGLVRISAAHEGSSVVLEVSDDGRGLDTARIRARAVERGLVPADAVLDDAAIHALIFEPGFSTADAVSDVSGRGVGMDVVLRSIEAMNGAVSIRSEAGAGSTFRIEVPLTLAIIEGMCMRVGATTFVLPLTSIVESLRPAAGQLRPVLGRGEVIGVRGQQLPLVRLHQVLAIDGAVTDPRQGLVVIVEDRGRRVGVLVDDVVGQAQVVVKGLETHFRRVDGLVGATILGDGHVALILDAQKLVRGSAVAARAPSSRTAPGASP